LGVTLVAAFLFLNSVGYTLVALYYLAVLLYPFSYLFSGVSLDPSLVLPWIACNNWYLVFSLLFSSTLSRNLVFQTELLTSQVFFYLALSAAVVSVAWGLLRMKNWARIATEIHAVLYLALTFILFMVTQAVGYNFFNTNPFSILLFLLGFDETVSLGLRLAVFILMVAVPILFITAVLPYLEGNIKYDFQRGEGPSIVESLTAPMSVTLIAFFLLLNAFGSMIVAFYYLEALINPLFSTITRNSIIYYWFTHYWYVTRFLGPAQWMLLIYEVPQSKVPLWASQAVFYTSLCSLLIILAVGLLKLKNWARLATIAYSALYLISAFTVSLNFTVDPLQPFVDNMFRYFNINILAVLPFQLYGHYFLAFLDFIIPLIFGIYITLYLLGNVKYEFQKRKSTNKHNF